MSIAKINERLQNHWIENEIRSTDFVLEMAIIDKRVKGLVEDCVMMTAGSWCLNYVF